MDWIMVLPALLYAPDTHMQHLSTPPWARQPLHDAACRHVGRKAGTVSHTDAPEHSMASLI